MLHQLDELLYDLRLVVVRHLAEAASQFLSLMVLFAHLLACLQVLRLFLHEQLSVFVDHLTVLFQILAQAVVLSRVIYDLRNLLEILLQLTLQRRFVGSNPRPSPAHFLI